jgi:hypothetical protein
MEKNLPCCTVENERSLPPDGVSEAAFNKKRIRQQRASNDAEKQQQRIAVGRGRQRPGKMFSVFNAKGEASDCVLFLP